MRCRGRGRFVPALVRERFVFALVYSCGGGWRCFVSTRPVDSTGRSNSFGRWKPKQSTSGDGNKHSLSYSTIVAIHKWRREQAFLLYSTIYRHRSGRSSSTGPGPGPAFLLCLSSTSSLSLTKGHRPSFVAVFFFLPVFGISIYTGSDRTDETSVAVPLSSHDDGDHCTVRHHDDGTRGNCVILAMVNPDGSTVARTSLVTASLRPSRCGNKAQDKQRHRTNIFEWVNASIPACMLHCVFDETLFETCEIVSWRMSGS